MGKQFKAGATPFANAAAYLAGGRNTWDRPIANNTRLRRIDDDTIAVVFHETAVVTYHRDGMMTVFGGGWNSMSTRRRISEYSPAIIGTTTDGDWIVGYTGERTPAKVRKCRSCQHRGRWMQTSYCYGPRRYGSDWCRGGTTVHDVALDGHLGNWDAYRASARIVACEHGHDDAHATVACQHGHLEDTAHAVGEHEIVCHRCEGTGMTDYGSKKIPILADAYAPIVIDADGTYVGTTVMTPKAGPFAVPKPLPVKAEPEHQHHLGSIVEDRLATVLPGLSTPVNHPVESDKTLTISATIISLNDIHGWSRERIADWLDTLDADLRFPTAA